MEGIRLAAQWVPGPVIIESDCSRIVQVIHRDDDRSEIGFIVAEARELAQLLVEWKVAQVKRGCNEVANKLAQLARKTTHTAVYQGHAPACVEDLVAAECNTCS